MSDDYAYQVTALGPDGEPADGARITLTDLPGFRYNENPLGRRNRYAPLRRLDCRLLSSSEWARQLQHRDISDHGVLQKTDKYTAPSN